MLQNEYLVAKIGVDTAENEESQVSLRLRLPRVGLGLCVLGLAALLLEGRAEGLGLQGVIERSKF